MQQMKCREAFAAECGLFTKNLYGGLKDSGVFHGIAVFDRCEPEKVRYRLQPAQK